MNEGDCVVLGRQTTVNPKISISISISTYIFIYPKRFADAAAAKRTTPRAPVWRALFASHQCIAVVAALATGIFFDAAVVVQCVRSESAGNLTIVCEYDLQRSFRRYTACASLPARQVALAASDLKSTFFQIQQIVKDLKKFWSHIIVFSLPILFLFRYRRAFLSWRNSTLWLRFVPILAKFCPDLYSLFIYDLKLRLPANFYAGTINFSTYGTHGRLYNILCDKLSILLFKSNLWSFPLGRLLFEAGNAYGLLIRSSNQTNVNPIWLKNKLCTNNGTPEIEDMAEGRF